jgi:hypothetical protein
MGFSPRTLFIVGAGLLVLSGICYGTLRLTYGERAAFIHVRWAANVDPATQEQIERTHSLLRQEFREQRTWTYFMTDVTSENIRSLVQNPAVEDTHHIDRRAFSIASTSERGDYSTDRPIWIADLLEFVIDVSLLGGAVALVAGAYKLWQARAAAPRRSAVA